MDSLWCFGLGFLGLGLCLEHCFVLSPRSVSGISYLSDILCTSLLCQGLWTDRQCQVGLAARAAMDPASPIFSSVQVPHLVVFLLPCSPSPPGRPRLGWLRLSRLGWYLVLGLPGRLLASPRLVSGIFGFPDILYTSLPCQGLWTDRQCQVGLAARAVLMLVLLIFSAWAQHPAVFRLPRSLAPPARPHLG